jgi:hypothetical protein
MHPLPNIAAAGALACGWVESETASLHLTVGSLL